MSDGEGGDRGKEGWGFENRFVGRCVREFVELVK